VTTGELDDAEAWLTENAIEDLPGAGPVGTKAFWLEVVAVARRAVIADDAAAPASMQDDGGRSFAHDLAKTLNYHSRENGSDTPDWILADFLNSCLEAFNHTVRTREVWYGREPTETGAPLHKVLKDDKEKE
jgi:hypothetical protein